MNTQLLFICEREPVKFLCKNKSIYILFLKIKYHHEVLRRSKCICTLILEHLSMCALRNLLMYLRDIQENIFRRKIVKSFDVPIYLLLYLRFIHFFSRTALHVAC